MEKHLRAFIEAHPEGWDHEEWLALLAELEREGYDVSDTDAVGWELERERLAWELRRKQVPGLGPKRIGAVVERFGTLWSLRHAHPEDVADIKTIHGKLAEKVVDAVR
ncbi:MAG: hypothetical protein R3304_04795 [Longimicrobiales bacterium]|nr:hypothetical protein [Longimicrobiales bacterium]